MTFDVAARLDQGRPSVSHTQTYVAACHTLGYQHPDLTANGAQVLDWYGAEDGMVPPSHGAWLRDQLPDARLEIRPGEGHGAVIFPRFAEVFATLTS